MNSFLLTLTAVLILVLGALFAAPLFIDWNNYRPVFEAQAAKLLGRAVKVGGEVHLVLLPAPELRFDDVKVAGEHGSFDQPLLEAKSIEAWLNIGALLGGGVEARKITISDPVLRLTLREDGSGNWSDVGRPGEALPLAAKDVLLDEVNVTGGRIELTRPGAPALLIERVDGAASAASLTGPYKVSATYDLAGRHQELRFSTSASDPAGLFRLKAALRDPDRSTTYLLEGDVTGLRAMPSYAGNIVVRIAPNLPAEAPAAGQPTAGQQALNAAPPAPEPPAGDEAVGQEANVSAFELKGALNATPDRAELPAFELTLHAKGRSQILKGKLALDFGEHRKAVGELSARWIDVDLLLALGAPAKAPGEASLGGAVNALAERVLAEAAAVGEGALNVTLEQASIGGDLVGDVDLALASRDGAVTIQRLKAELPGETKLEASGQLISGEAGPVFTGPVKLAGSKLKTLARWAAGDREMSGQATVGAFALAATATIGAGNLALEEASGELSGTKFSGALRYHGGERRLIDLALDSDRLDMREVMGDSAAWRGWLPASAKDKATGPDFGILASLRDDEAHVTLRVGELLLPNIPPGKLDAKFTLAKDSLDVERLDFAAAGAIGLNGKGHIESLSAAPSGQVDFALQAATPEALRVAAELSGLDESVTKSKQLAAFAPLDLQVGLTAVRDGAATKTSMQWKGKAGAAEISLSAKALGDPAKLAEAEIDIDGTIAGDRPQAMLGLLIPGLAPDQLALAGAEPGKLTLKAHGVPETNVTGRVELATATTQASFDGKGALKPEGVALTGQAAAKTGNAALVLALLGLEPAPSATGVPLELRADLNTSRQSLDLSAISGQIAGQAVQGNAHFDLTGDKARFTLKANADYVSLPALLGALVAWQRTPSTEDVLGTIAQNASDLWPARGFALRPLEGKAGEIEIKANTLALGAPFQIGDAVLTARIDQNGISLTNLDGELFGGSFAASGILSPKGAGAELKAHAELASGKLDLLTQSLAGRVLAKGLFTVSFDIAGEGLSPPGLVAGLSGDGTLFLDPGALQALSLEPLKRVAVEANRKARLDKDQIAAQLQTLQEQLTHGTYAYTETALPFEIKNGTLKLDPVTLASKGAETTVNGYLELASLRLDSEWGMRLSGNRDADMPPVNLVIAGSLGNAGAISPVIDTSPIETFLTVSRMQEDVQRLETLDVSGRSPSQTADAESDSAAQDTDEPAPPVAANQALAAEKADVQKRAADRAAARIAEAKRIADEKAAAERAVAEKAAAEKAAAEKLAAEKAAADKLAAQQAAAAKAAVDKAVAEKAAADKRAAQQAVAEKAAAEKAAAEEKRAAEKAAAEQAAAEKRVAEKAAAEKLAADKAAAKKVAAEKVAAEKAAAEEKRLADKAAAAKAAEEKRLADKAAAEKAAADKAAVAKAAEEKRVADKAAAEKVAEDKRLADKAAAEKAAEDKRLADKAAAEKAAEDKRLADKAAADKAAAEKAAEAKRITDANAKTVPSPTAAAVPPVIAPRAADVEANGGAPGGSPPPGQALEDLPWRQVPVDPTLAQPEPATGAQGEPTPDAAAVDAAAVPPEPKVQRRRPPPAAPDDWKKGVSIFGGG